KKTEKLRKDAVEKAIAAVKSRLESEEEMEESGIPEITADHPEVQTMVEEAMKRASEIPLPQIHAGILEEAIAELMKTNKDRFPDASEKGGWVMDNYPLSVGHWSALSEKGLLPDTVVCLRTTEKDGYIDCYKRSQKYLSKCLFFNSFAVHLGSAMVLLEQGLTALRADMGPWAVGRWGESQGLDGDSQAQEILQPNFAEDRSPDTQEMETIRKNFMNDWQAVESQIKKSPQVQVAVLEIAEQTSESLLNQTVLVMEKPFKYHGWELSNEDLEEEAQDLAAEEEIEEEEEEEE
ncbi:KAD9 kinase, partial [Grantiella picta]|nr:KAD9 kinase [Grantiella picta]